MWLNESWRDKMIVHPSKKGSWLFNFNLSQLEKHIWQTIFNFKAGTFELRFNEMKTQFWHWGQLKSSCPPTLRFCRSSISDPELQGVYKKKQRSKKKSSTRNHQMTKKYIKKPKKIFEKNVIFQSTGYMMSLQGS